MAIAISSSSRVGTGALAVKYPILWDIVEQNLDESAFLSTVWERALRSFKHTAAAVAEGPEERLRAHLDGVTLAGTAAIERLLAPALKSKLPGSAFSAALAIAQIPTSPLAPIVGAIRDGTPATAAACGRALGLCGRRDEVEAELRTMVRSEQPQVRATALSTMAYLRFNPGPEVWPLLSADNPTVRAAALRASRPWGERLTQFLVRDLEHGDSTIRNAAIEVGLLLGIPEAWHAVVGW